MSLAYLVLVEDFGPRCLAPKPINRSSIELSNFRINVAPQDCTLLEDQRYGVDDEKAYAMPCTFFSGFKFFTDHMSDKKTRNERLPGAYEELSIPVIYEVGEQSIYQC